MEVKCFFIRKKYLKKRIIQIQLLCKQIIK